LRGAALAAAAFPRPVILTVILTLGSALMKASANASAVGPAVVDRSIWSVCSVRPC